jgi:hypothetical protein
MLNIISFSQEIQIIKAPEQPKKEIIAEPINPDDLNFVDIFKQTEEEKYNEFGNQPVRLRQTPKDEYAFRKFMKETDNFPIDDIGRILPKELAIANIKDDFVITLTEERLGICVMPLYDMAIQGKDTALLQYAEWFRRRLIASLKLSRSKGGFERLMDLLGMNSSLAQNTGFAEGIMMPKKEKETSEIEQIKKTISGL